jgi:hypothetical protein
MVLKVAVTVQLPVTLPVVKVKGATRPVMLPPQVLLGVPDSWLPEAGVIVHVVVLPLLTGLLQFTVPLPFATPLTVKLVIVLNAEQG